MLKSFYFKVILIFTFSLIITAVSYYIWFNIIFPDDPRWVFSGNMADITIEPPLEVGETIIGNPGKPPMEHLNVSAPPVEPKLEVTVKIVHSPRPWYLHIASSVIAVTAFTFFLCMQ